MMGGRKPAHQDRIDSRTSTAPEGFALRRLRASFNAATLLASGSDGDVTDTQAAAVWRHGSIGGSHMAADTNGLNHLGLAVASLDQTTAFFVGALGWKETARDDTYPRNSVTDGHLRLTLWQVDQAQPRVGFNRRRNVGLHHLALTVGSEADLDHLAQKVAAWPGVTVEFMPEPVGKGPRKHMIFAEPGGLRLELIWPGE